MANQTLPSPELLRQLLDYDPETGKLHWRERTAEMFASASNPDAVNRRNRSRHCNNTSGETGVAWHHKSRRWQATLGRRYVGTFRDFDDAVRARRLAAKEAGYHPAPAALREGTRD